MDPTWLDRPHRSLLPRSLPLVAAAALLALLGSLPVHADVEDGEAPIELGPSSDVYLADVDDADDDDDGGRKRWSVGGRAAGWFSLLEAEVEVGEDGIAGTDIDLTADLDLDEFAVVPYAEVFITTPWVALHADYWRVEREGSATLTGAINFAGVTFAASTPVEGKLSIETAGAWLELTPFSFDSFHLGLVVGARYYWLEGSIERETFPRIEESETLEGPLPIAGLTFAVYPGPFEIYGRAHGFYIEYADDDYDVTAAYADFEVGVALNIGDHLAVGAGYKGVWLDVEELGEEAEGDEQRFAVLQHGPIVWVRLRL